MDKARAMQILSEAGAFSGPLEWPEGAVGLRVGVSSGYMEKGSSVYISREEFEAGRRIEYWSETLKSPDVIVQVEPEESA